MGDGSRNKISAIKSHSNQNSLWGRGGEICKCRIKSNFQNYGRMVVDSLKRPSRRVEKENI